MDEQELLERLADLTIKSAPSDSQTKTIRVGFFSLGIAGKTCIIKWFSEEFDALENTIHGTVTRTVIYPNDEPIQYIIEEVGSTQVGTQLLHEMLSRVNIAVLCCRPANNQTEADLWRLVQETRESLYGRTMVFVLTYKDVDDDHTDKYNPSSKAYKYKLFSEAYKTFSVSSQTGEGMPELWEFIGSHARQRYNPDYVKKK